MTTNPTPEQLVALAREHDCAVLPGKGCVTVTHLTAGPVPQPVRDALRGRTADLADALRAGGDTYLNGVETLMTERLGATIARRIIEASARVQSTPGAIEAFGS
jgi:hypothetical protein